MGDPAAVALSANHNLSRRYKKPIVITENGIATSKDVKRVRYLFTHMLEVKEAIDDGYDVRGYFVWTLVDNYEWHHVYKAPFGLSRMDPLTKRRLLRPSALFTKAALALLRKRRCSMKSQ
jgi:beta-glucosidase